MDALARVLLLRLHVQQPAARAGLGIGAEPVALQQQRRLHLQAALDRARVRLGVADRIGTERRRIVHEIARIQRTGVRVPDPDMAGAVSGEVDDLELQAAHIEDVAVLDRLIDLDREVPIFPDDLGVGQPEAFPGLQIEVLEHLFGRDAEAGDVVAPGHDHRVLDDRAVERMAHDLGAIALLDHVGVADMVVMEVGDDDVFERVLLFVQ